MKKLLYEKLKNYCVEHELLKPNDGVVIGFSGGADSLCLLRFLVQLRSEWGLRLCAVHINHGIRGQRALEDEKASEKLARDASVDFQCFSADIPGFALEQGISAEEAGRIYRYRCFEQVRKERGFDRVAVAHHRDDQAETVLWQILRGSGVRGLGGIRPKRGSIIRPLLALERREIEEILRAEQLVWCEDESNYREDYTRNKLRNSVFPYLEKEVQTGTKQHLAVLAEECQLVWEYLEKQTAECYKNIVWEPEGKETDFKVSVAAIKSAEPVLQRLLVLTIMERLAGSRKDLGRTHVDAVMRLLAGETGKRVDLPYGMQALRDYGWLRFRKASPAGRGGHNAFAGVIDMLYSGKTLCFTDTQGQENEIYLQTKVRAALPSEVPKNDCTKWFDCDKMNADVMAVFGETALDGWATVITWRFPAEGDYLCLNASGDRKRLSRLLVDEKVSVEQRKELLVLAIGRHILWIPELGRTSAAFYVTDDTKNVLEAQLKRQS